jgi:flagellar protein FlaF
MPSNPHQAVTAYNKALTETATPRQLEAQLLLKAAATLQRVLDSRTDKPSGLNEAVLYNRRLWIVFIDAVIRDG